MSEVLGYYLTKVTAKYWAERFLDGEIYMRSLSHFSDMLLRSQDANNTFRGDIFEGAVAVTGASGPGSAFLKDAFNDKFPANGHVVWLSEPMRQLRIYCLYCLEYSTNLSAFVAPHTRVHEFGDTAVLIIHPIEFFARLRRCFSGRSINLNMCAAKRVNYSLDSSVSGDHDEFSKHPNYSWQKEYRLSIDLSMGRLDRLAWCNMSDLVKIRFLNQGGEVDLASFGEDRADVDAGRSEWTAKSVLSKIQYLNERCPKDVGDATAEDLGRNALVLQLGSIRDICVSISTADLVALKIPHLEHNPYVVPPLHRIGMNSDGCVGP